MKAPITIPQRGLGDSAREGSMYMVVASGVAKTLGLASQIALAWLLTRRQFGVYAIAISLSVLFSVIRDGGLPMVLMQKGRRFDFLAGPVFWMMLVINTATAATIAAIATPAAFLYNEPELAAVILLFAISVPLSVPSSILIVRLASELKFRQLSVIQLLSAAIRNSLLLVFAWSGFGARSFILPLLVTSVTDAVMLWYVSPFSPWRMPPRFKIWPRLMRSGRWVLLGTFAIAFGNNGAYFVLGKVLPSEVVGTYFFAYQIVVQLGTLLSDNVYRVLFAAFVQMTNDIARIRAAVRRSLSVIILVGAGASLFIAVIFKPLDEILWHQKWASATGAIYVFAALWPASAGTSVMRALQSATGRFREWGVVTLVTAIASVLGAIVGAMVGGTATTAALGFGVGLASGTALSSMIALAPLGIGAAHMLTIVMRPWLVVTVAAVLSAYAGSLGSRPLLSFALSAVCFIGVSWVGSRLFATESLQILIESTRRIWARA